MEFAGEKVNMAEIGPMTGMFPWTCFVQTQFKAGRFNANTRDYPDLFDFIHTRVTIGCWSDMKTQIIERAFDHLQPGGWLECQEIPCMIGCDDGTMPDDYGWLRWVREFQAAGQLAQRDLNVGPHIKDWMREVGFVDIHESVFKIPINGWPKEMRLKHVGMMWQRNLLEGVSAFSLGMFNRFLGKTVEEIEVSADQVLFHAELWTGSLTSLVCSAFLGRRTEKSV